MKNIIHIASISIPAIGLMIILGFVEQAQGNLVCTSIDIDIDRSNGNYFVEEEDIFAMVYHEMDTLIGRPIAAINAEGMEHKINNHSSVYNAEVFKTLDGTLRIEVQQRTPVVRLFAKNGDTYYIDSIGNIMPASKRYTARVLVANGFIFDSFVRVNAHNMKTLSDSLAQRLIVDDVFKLVEYIRQSTFWDAQIEQLYVNKELEFELIPRVGNHRIVFGDASSIAQKFNKLKIFYEKGLSKTGWNEYSTINLKFANQVVCTKR